MTARPVRLLVKSAGMLFTSPMRCPLPLPAGPAAALAVLAFGIAAAPAAAQTTPTDGPPALLTPAPLNTPFDAIQLSPGQPLRNAPRGAFLPPGAPQPAVPSGDGRVELDLSARFESNGPVIPAGLQWRVFHDEADQNGDLPLAEDSTQSAPHFRLMPGGYVIHAVYGLASTSKHVFVEQSVNEQIVLPAGAVKLLAVVGEKAIDAGQVTFKLTANDGAVDRAVADNLRPNALVRLPAGQYHVVSNFGDANAVVEVDVRVEPGKLVEATVHHKAAAMGFRLVEGDSGSPVDNTSWSILTPGGDVVREAISPQPEFVLAEGKYLALARHDGRSYSRDFTVVSGQDQKLDIVRSEASAVTPSAGAKAQQPNADGGGGEMEGVAEGSADGSSLD